MDSEVNQKAFFRDEEALEKKLQHREAEFRRQGVKTAAIVLLVIAIVGGSYLVVSRLEESWVGPLGAVVAFAAIFFTCCTRIVIESARRAQHSIRKLENVSQEHLGEIKEIIDSRFRPRVEPLNSTKELAAESARWLRAVRKDDENVSGVKIVYIGSLGLGSRDGSAPIESSGAPGERNAFTDYVAEQTLLTKDKIRQERHICLIEPKAFAKRGSAFQSSYLAWTTHQVQLLQDNSEYWLFHRPRAPRWGASTSWMFAGPAVLQIVGDGVAGTLILGDAVVNNVKDAIFRYLDDGHNAPIRYTSQDLEQYRKELIDAARSDGKRAA